MQDATAVIEALHLEPHPEEGGWFRETWRSRELFAPGDPYAGERPAGTAIFYLLTADDFSAMHRLPGDELFHFYLGDPVEMLELLPDGRARSTLLGPDIPSMQLQHAVPGGNWQGSRLVEGGRWALLGATMSPGFAYEDYEHGSAELLDQWPGHAAAIRARLSGGGGGS